MSAIEMAGAVTMALVLTAWVLYRFDQYRSDRAAADQWSPNDIDGGRR